MKVIINESEHGLEYAWEVVSACEKTGIQCIADERPQGEILFYDPKGRKYATDKDLMDADVQIWNLFDDNGQKTDIYDEVMLDAIGKDFEKFSVKWNANQKQVGEKDIMATKNCNRIIGNYNETRIVGKRKPSKEFLDKVEQFKKKWRSLGKPKADDEEDYVDDFGDRVNGIEAQVSEGRQGNITGTLDEKMSDWYREAYPTDSEMADEMEIVGNTFNDLWRDLNLGRDVYKTIGADDSIVRERVFQHLSELTGKQYRTIYNMWLKSVDESFDSAVVYWKPLPDDKWPPSVFGGVHDIEGVLNEVKFMAQQCPEGDVPEIDHIMIGNKEYDERDIDKVRREMEKEEIEMYRENHEDDPRDWSSNEDEIEVQWMIDDKELGIESGEIETVVIDLDLVDCFEELVYQVELALEKAHGGMRFDYYDEWILVDEDNLLKRFGYNMNESGSNGGTIDVTIKFTHGHYGKKLEAGDERTIKVDLSTAPEEMYDEDDFMAWIAKVASDQVPGGGYISKYDFEIPDDEAYEIIKVVKGEDGFGPDVDVDFDDPDSIPSEVSYEDALKMYKKMREAYDDHKVNYNKFKDIKDKVIDGVVNGLLKKNSIEDLAEKWFIDYGTANGWGWKTSFKYSIASKLHEIHKKKHPDEHEPDRVDTVRGWHEDNCSCGFCSSSDSSD